MKKIYGLSLMLLALVAFQGVASAKEVSGTIAGIDAAANKMSLSTQDESGAESSVDILVNATTSYAGAASLADLTVGQQVSVEASEDVIAGGWMASSVKVAEPVAAEDVLDQLAEEEPAK